MTALNSVISDAFVLYHKYFKQILLLTSVQVIGGLVFLALFICYWTGVHLLNSRQAVAFFGSNLTIFYPLFVIGFFVFVLLFILLLLISTATFILFMHKHETNTVVTFEQALGKAFLKLPSLIVVSLVMTTCYVFNSAFPFPLNLLAVFVTVLISQAYFFVLLEDSRLLAAFGSSKQVTKGNRRWLVLVWLLPLGFSPAVLGYAIWRWLTKVQV